MLDLLAWFLLNVRPQIPSRSAGVRMLCEYSPIAVVPLKFLITRKELPQLTPHANDADQFSDAGGGADLEHVAGQEGKHGLLEDEPDVHMGQQFEPARPDYENHQAGRAGGEYPARMV